MQRGPSPVYHDLITRGAVSCKIEPVEGCVGPHNSSALASSVRIDDEAI